MEIYLFCGVFFGVEVMTKFHELTLFTDFCFPTKTDISCLKKLSY